MREIFAQVTFALVTIVLFSKKDWYYRLGIWHTDLTYKMKVYGLRLEGLGNVILERGTKVIEPYYIHQLFW